MDLQGFVQLAVIVIATITTWLVLSSNGDKDLLLAGGFAAVTTLLLVLATGVAITAGPAHAGGPADWAFYIVESLFHSLEKHFANAELGVCLVGGILFGIAAHLIYPASKVGEG